ncbi:MAG: hypothetical protein PF569_05460 [Candidatus Woesearchaeota archaeon]|nr:hypothetical protein [Candidatus Woesearchaeota archaeon]
MKLNVFIFSSNKFWWDEVVYVSLAKFFYSFGGVGFFDGVRPVFFSLFLGIFWFLGLDIVIFSKLTVILFAMGNLYLVYKIAEEMYEGSGFLSVLVLASTQMFLFVSNLIVSEQFSLFFVLLGFYFVLKKKPFWAGFVLGIAFLSRFFNGIYLPILFCYFIFNNYKKGGFLFSLKGLFVKFVKYICGFMILVLPYLIMNYIYFGDMLHTIKRASLVVLDSAFLYDSGMFFYFFVLLKQNRIILLVALFFIIYNFNKGFWSSKKINFLLFTFLIPFIYLSLILTHNEPRYVFSVLPFAAIISGVFLNFVLNKFVRDKFKQIGKIMLIVFLFLLFIFTNFYAYNIFSEYNSEELEFYNYFEDFDEEVVLLTTDITFLMFSEIEIYSLPFWDFWERKFFEADYRITHIAIKNCEVYCVDGLDCEEKETLDVFLDKQEILFDKDIGVYGDTFCNFKIYEVVEGLE